MIDRRQLLALGTSAVTLSALGVRAAESAAPTRLAEILRPIPSSGEMLPVIGMGTSRTFDTDDDPDEIAILTSVMQAFVEGGGTVIDSSPMYGRAEQRVGEVLGRMQPRPNVFTATKVWTSGREQGIEQMEESARLMGTKVLDLIAVHNLKDWKTQLATLKQWKQEGKVRYIGVTTSHGRDHDDVLSVMAKEPLDFVQFSYNIEDREAEKKLLPLAQDRGIATMINRPYQRGSLFGDVKGQSLPPLAAELDCMSWGQFFLKFILSHPAVTCIIPATANAKHMRDNMGANFGRVPDAEQRAEMLSIFEAL
ncbi:MAG: aldo/keto reductase [Pseudomonadota bacterium]